MDWRKLPKMIAFSEHFSYALSSRRKIVSGFGLGVGASLLVLTVILLCNPSKVSVFNPILQGFNSFSGNSSIVSWPFSFSTTSNSSSPDSQKSVDLIQERVQEKTHEGNVSEVSKNASLLDSNGVDMVTEKTHVGNFSEKEKNGSFSSGEGWVGEKTHQGNFSADLKNASFSGKEETVLGKSVGSDLKNASFSGKEETVLGKSFGRDTNETVLGKSEGFTENNHDGKNRVTEKNNMGNVSDSRESTKTLGREEKVPETIHQENSKEKDKMASVNYDSGLMKSLDSSSRKCDIFDGRWARDDSKPYYPAGSCPHIDRDFDCHLHGRPDDVFLKWRWQPTGCDIPSLNATDFLERLRGKRLVFVGDSLNRNMWESLVCILRHSVADKSRVYEISGRREFKKKGFYAFRYEDYNCSIDFVSSPFLVRESSFNGRNGSFETLRLDLMDPKAMLCHGADVVVFNTGHWWTHEKTSRGEDYYQEGNHVHPKLKVMEAYKKALTTWARWVDKNIDVNITQVFFRGYSVTHFRGGQWNSGGQCHKETEPIFNQTHLAKYPSKMRALEHVLQEMRTPVVYLNISRLTDYRKDAHPSIYRKEYKTVKEQLAAELSQDCSHWCLPGVPDTWNELLYASLLKSGRGSWRN